MQGPAATRSRPRRCAKARSRICSSTHGRVAGVRRSATARSSRAGAVVLTTGTFLRGVIHLGEEKMAGGPGRRARRPSASRDACDASASRLGRFKTGTPPRLNGRTIDFAGLEVQPGDDPPVPFSFLTERLPKPQMDCQITYTNAETHDLIRANLHRAPMYSGQIAGRGPRYCPPSRTRSSASPTASGTRSSSSPKAWTTTPSI